jgi:hypothetical protein
MQATANSFNTGLPNSGMSNSYAEPNAMWSQTNTFNNAMKPPENIAQPPRPASVSSTSSQPTTTSAVNAGPPKAKRLLDPSVSNNVAGYGQIPAAASPYNPNLAFNANNNPTFNASPMQPTFNANPIQPAAFNTNPISAMPLQPSQTNAWDQPPQQQQQSMYGGYSNLNGSSSFMPPPTMPTNVQKNPTPPPGWNDPPEFKQRAQVCNFISIKIQLFSTSTSFYQRTCYYIIFCI